MLRAIRFANQLNFEIEEKNSLKSISKMHSRITIISGERIVDELNKILSTDKPSIGFYYFTRQDSRHSFTRVNCVK
jgi:tRNA nucleotidyltransferase (CCA-adding enzyme)